MIDTGRPGIWARPGYHAIDPIRVADTRAGTNTPSSSGVKLPGGAIHSIDVATTAGLPAVMSAVAINLTVTEPTAASFLTVYPGEGPRPVASSIEFAAGQTLSSWLVTATTQGIISVFNNAGATHVIVDVYGFYV
jgi:hypothetical protein